MPTGLMADDPRIGGEGREGGGWYVNVGSYTANHICGPYHYVYGRVYGDRRGKPSASIQT
jgi:hypothetical protein